MAKNIKGITIELNGDSTKLNKALNETNKQTRALNSELKYVEKNLKLDPKNIELLSQKKTILAEKVKTVNSTLNILRQGQKELEKEFGDSVEGQEAYRKIRREIIETESALIELAQEQDVVNKSINKMPIQSVKNITSALDNASEKTKEFGNKIKDVGANLTTNVTLPLVALGTATSVAFKEVDNAMDIVAIKTGASGKALEDMQKIVENLSTEIPTSFENSGKAVGEINTRFGATGEELKQLSTQFIKFAEINKLDVSNSIDKVQKVITSYKVEIKDTGLILDTLNEVGQRTGINIDNLTSLLITHSASMQQMGFNASQSANFLGNLEVSGADVNQVLSGLQKALIKATKEGKPLNEYLVEASKNMLNAKTQTQALQIAYDTFGNKSGSAIYQALKNGSISFDELSSSIKDNIGSVNETFETVIDPIDKFTTSFNQVKLLGAELGATLMDVLIPMLDIITGVIKNLRDSWQSLSPQMQETIIKITLLVASIGPLLTIVGQIIVGIGSLMSVVSNIINFINTLISLLPMLMTGLKALFALLIANPIGLIIGAITALVGAFIYFYKTNEDFRNKVNEAWENVKIFCSNAINSIIQFMQNLGEKTKAFTDFIINIYIKLPLKMLSIGADIVKGLWDGISGKVTWLKNKVMGFASGIITSIKDKLAIKSPSRVMRDEVGKMIVKGLAIGIDEEKDTLNNSIAKLSDEAIAKAKEKAKDYNEMGKIYLEYMDQGIKEKEKDNIKHIESIVNESIEKIKDKKAKEEYKKAGKEVIEAYSSSIKNSFASIQEQIKNDISKITEEAQKQYDSIIQSKNAMAKKLADFGDLYIIDNETNELVISNINDQIEAIKRYEDILEKIKAKGVSEDFLKEITSMGVKEGTDFGSKLLSVGDKRFEEYVSSWEEKQKLAKDLSTKFYADQLENLEKDFSTKLDSKLMSIPERLKEVGKNTIQGMIDGMEGKKGEAIVKAKEIAEAIKSTMQESLDIHSPSRLMRDLIGKNIVKGVVVGIDEEMFRLTNKINDMTKVIQNTTTINNKSGDINLHIANFNNVRNDDIGGLARELQFYSDKRKLR